MREGETQPGSRGSSGDRALPAPIGERPPADPKKLAGTFGGLLILATCCIVVVLPYVAIPGVPIGSGLSWAALERSAGLGLGVLVLLLVAQSVGTFRRHASPSLVDLSSELTKELPFHLGLVVVFTLASWPATYAWCAFENARFRGAPASIVCTVLRCGRRRCDLVCREPSGRRHEDRQPRDVWIPPVGASFRGAARRGALGVWVLDTRTIHVVPASEARAPR